MIPNFNPNKWDKQKVIDYVIGNEPLDDQQMAFLGYFDKLQQENEHSIYILTEFEKWLEERIKSTKLSLIEIITFKRCLEELQELKEGK